MDNIDCYNPGLKIYLEQEKNSDYSQIDTMWRFSCVFSTTKNKYVRICINICLK